MDAESKSRASSGEDAQADTGRRDFVRRTGKALYLAPALTLLGSVQASAQLPSPPCDPGGGTCGGPFAAPAPPAPDAPVE